METSKADLDSATAAKPERNNQSNNNNDRKSLETGSESGTDIASITSKKIVSNAASIDVITVPPPSDYQDNNSQGDIKLQHDQSFTKENFLMQYYRRKTKGLSKSQLGILFIFPFVEFFAATVISIQGPFYPQVARSKGATPTEYGLVFGSFELTVFICAPIMGAKMGQLKPHRLFNYGIFTTSLCCIIFGFLHHFDGRYTFIISSIIVRVIEAVGDAGFVTASFSIIAAEFPDSVASTFACAETFYGLGMIAGPTIGGYLFLVGGFTLPFVVMGTLLLCSAVATYFFITKTYADKSVENIVSSSSFDMFTLLLIKPIAIIAFSTFAAASAIGFLSNNLQRHLEQFGVNEFEVGSIFMLNGGVYALSAPLFGKLCEKSSQPKLFSLIGSALTILGFALIGPLPFFQSWNPSVLLISIGLVIFGLGLGSTLVSAFLLFLQDSIANGRPEDVTTHGLVSGLWTSMTGFFVGPTIGGFLDHHVGFRWGTLFIFAEQFIVIGLLTHFFIQVYQNRSPSSSTCSKRNKHEKGSEANDDLNDIVITYAVKMDTPKPVKQRNKGKVTAESADKEATTSVAQDRNPPIPTEEGLSNKNCDAIGVENPNFEADCS